MYITLFPGLFWSENLRGRDYLEDLGVDWRMRLNWLRTESNGEHGNEPSVSIKGREFLLDPTE
jgi:hypothetical protein